MASTKLRFIAKTLLAVAAGGALYAFGYLYGDRMPGSGFLTRAAARARRIVSSGPVNPRINTILLRLEYTRYPIPMER